MRRRLVVLLLAGGLLAGCGGVPTSGDVRRGNEQAAPANQPGGVMQYKPGPPRERADRESIVNGFLEAMTDPANADIARLYLTKAAAAAWRPGARTIVYDSSAQGKPREAPDSTVVLEAKWVGSLDQRGSWQPPGPGGTLRHPFQLVTENGQWRIQNPPVGTMISPDQLNLVYSQYNLYFFNQAMNQLVPDPVYLPRTGTVGQVATRLTEALLKGPTGRLGRDVLKTAAPPNATFSISVPVDAGVATVALDEAVARLGVTEKEQLLQRDQFRLGGTVVAGVGEAPAAGKVTVADGDDDVVLTGQDFRYVLDRTRGTLTSMRARGKELLRRGPELDVWRPPTSNETYDWGIADRQRWNPIGLDRLRTTVSSVRTRSLPDGRAELTVTSVAAAPGHTAELSFEQTMTYTVDAAGAITLAHQVTPKGSRLNTLPYLPRVGFSLQVPDSLARFAYDGRGPEENYNDRSSGTRIGVYRSSVDEQYVRYSRPQAHGNHTDTRWASLSDRGRGVLVAASKRDSVDVSVTPYDRLDRAEYDFQLPLVRNRGWVTLHVGDAETGMGETPNGVQAPYRIDPAQPRSYAVTLRPLAAAEVGDGAPDVTGPPACDPTATVAAGDGWKQGEPHRVDVTVRGECALPVTGTTARLAAPEGWTVTPASVPLGSVAGGQTKTASFTVTPPADAQTGSYRLTATVGFTLATGRAGEASASASAALPLLPGQRWASELEFVGTPLNGWGPVERDTSNGEEAPGDGRPMQIGSESFAKGLGAHAVSSVTLALPAGCTRFTAKVGVDEETGSGGSVGFEVWAGDTKLASSPRLTGTDPAHALDVPLSSPAELRLAVTDGGDGNGLDHADWAAPLLTCTP